MIHWIWLIPAAMAGYGIGMILLAVLSANRED